MSWVLWTVAAGVLATAELRRRSLVFAAIALGALVAAILAAAGAGTAAAAIVCAATSICALALLRPLVLRRRGVATRIRAGAAALVGRTGVVVERIANREGVGCVRIGRDVWTARSVDDDRVIAAGTNVEIVEIRGATALVTE